MPEKCRVLQQNKIGIISVSGWLFKNKAVMGMGHLLIRSGPKYPKIFSIFFPGSFCFLVCSFLLSWVTCYEAFYLRFLFNFFRIPVFFPKPEVVLISSQSLYLFHNLSKCFLLFFSCISSLLLLFILRYSMILEVLKSS